MIFSGVDDLGDRLVVDAQIRRDAVRRRSLQLVPTGSTRRPLRASWSHLHRAGPVRVRRAGLSPSVTSIMVLTPIACTPDRVVHEREISEIRARVAELLPALAGKCLHAATCVYSNTPDRHFVIGRHPQCADVIMACGFSGHGFKFVSGGRRDPCRPGHRSGHRPPHRVVRPGEIADRMTATGAAVGVGGDPGRCPHMSPYSWHSWPSTTSGARRLRPGTVKPWSSRIVRARKSGVDSPGACRAPGWHGVRWANAAKLNR